MKKHEEILEQYAYSGRINTPDAILAMQQAVDEYKAALSAEFKMLKANTGYAGDRLFFDGVISIIETFDPAKLKTP